jgi:hypothetical protein
MKQVMVHFDFADVTQQQYDSVWDELRTSGNETSSGLLFHMGAPKPGGGWMVTDVWDSKEAFQQFARTLVPIIQKVAPNVSTQPIVSEARYVWDKQHAEAV